MYVTIAFPFLVVAFLFKPIVFVLNLTIIPSGIIPSKSPVPLVELYLVNEASIVISSPGWAFEGE
ncbi:hypothetical protein MBORA_11300 [Methanobrevibacter oralis]|uniref:Uncharacterized protein n=1 Tax=Methanobrevibacter oralis TaxID=66851 RepID=A0A166C9R0_METOA|nr:hypothetical protein MBORA_11300 [Methanobrevibacter oralis]